MPKESRARGGMYEQVVRRPVAAIMVTCLVVVFGLVSYQRLTLTLMPDISYPTITVRTEYPGAAPEEVETVVSRPMEQALSVVSHLVRISSVSRAELSDVILEFAWGTDMTEATQDAREKLERVYFQDDAVKRPLILRYDPSLDPIMRIALWGDADLFTLRRIAEYDVKRALESLDGVAAVRVRGGLEQEILVEVSEQKLALLGMDIGRIVSRLAQENVNLASGELREGLTEYMVRTLNEFRTLDEMRDLVVGERNGVPIRLSDIATVRSSNREREVITRMGNTESVEIELFKEGDANIVTVAQRVRNRLFGTKEQREYVAMMESKAKQDSLAAAKDTTGAARRALPAPPNQAMLNFVARQLPPGVHLEMVSDQSTFIQASLGEVTTTALLGGFLAVVILYLFLRNLPNTLIVALSIPISIIATFAAMYLGHVSLNIMSLGGLALGVGMLVDNSIVVLESIFRCREEGDGIVEGAVRGTREVGGAVTSSTLTTIAVFLPIVFVEGIAGQVFGDLSLAVVFSLLASLAVALWLIPMLASRRLSPGSASADLVERLRGSHIVRLWTFGSIRRLSDRFKGAQSTGERSKVVALLIGHVPLVIVEVLLRALATLAVLLLVVLRGVLAAVLPLCWPFAAPLWRWRRPDESYAAFCARTFKAEAWWRFGALTGRVWPPLLSYDAPELLPTGMGKAWSWFWKGAWWMRLLKAIPGLLRAVLVLVLFLASAVFALVGKALLVAALLVTLLAIGALALLGIMLLPIFVVLSAGFDVGYRWLASVYPRVIGWALQSHGARDNRVIVIVSALAAFVLSVFILLPRIGKELIPQVHQGEFYVDVKMSVGTPLEATNRVVERIEETARQIPGVQMVAARVGVEKTAVTGTGEGENTGRVTVTLSAKSDLGDEEARVMDALRRKLEEFRNIEAMMALPVLFTFKTPVEVEIKGFNLGKLKALSQQARDRLAVIPGFEDVESNIQPGNPEVKIAYDRRRLAELGLTPHDVATLIRTKVLGSVATRFRDESIGDGEERRVDVRVQLDRQDKAFISDLRTMVINPGQPVPLQLAAVADVEIVEGPSEIRRIGQQRVAVVSANLNGIDLGAATREIYGALNGLDWPEDISYVIGGQNMEMERSLNSLYFALALALFLVYVVMASQFESFLHPFVIMFTIPFALTGVILVLWAFSVPLSVVVFLGIIVLAGIVVNNAIVLVDYVNQLRRRGMSKTDALIQAGSVRLRPILMTTTTTVLGLIPMALGLGEGAEIRTPMAITVIAGLTSSTILTLVVIPTVYSVFDRRT